MEDLKIGGDDCIEFGGELDSDLEVEVRIKGSYLFCIHKHR